MKPSTTTTQIVDSTANTRNHDAESSADAGRRVVNAANRLLGILLFAMLSASVTQPMRAQATLTVFGAQTVVGDLGAATGIAVDAAGCLYVANANGVYIVDPNDISSSQSPRCHTGGIDTKGLAGYPVGVSLDSAGNLYIIDSTGTVYSVPAGSTTPTKWTQCGKTGALVAGINPAGYVYTANGGVVSICWATGSQIADPFEAAPATAVVTDGRNDFWFADSSGNIWEDTPIDDPPGLPTSEPGAPIGSGFGTVNAMTLYAGGSLLAADAASNSVLEWTGYGATAATFATGFNNPSSITADAVGNVYVADTGNNRVVRIQKRWVMFPPTTNCDVNPGLACGGTQQFTVGFSQSIAQDGPRVLTTGASGQDFTLNPNGITCAAANSLPMVCTYTIAFTPQHAGVRRGALQILDGLGDVLLQVPLYGIGMTGQPGFGPQASTITVPASGLNSPTAVAVDDAGNVFIADTYNNRVVEEPAGGGAQKTVVTGLSNPLGVAVDGAGDLFIADYGNKRVLEVAPTGEAWTEGSGFGGPAGIALDGAGDIFVSDYTNNEVIEVPNNPGGQEVVASGLDGPRGLAVDTYGNLYVASSNSGEVMAVSPSGVQTLVYTGAPYGVALDAAGDLYIADDSTTGVVEMTANGKTVPFSTGVSYPTGLALDGAGNIYLANEGANVFKVTASQPPSLTFDKTTVGQVSSDSPKSVEVWNIGINPLTFTSETTPADFPAGSSASACDFTGSGPIGPGLACDIAIDFKPTVPGVLNESVVLSSPSSLPSISVGVSGAAIANQTITFKPFPNVTYGAAPIALTAEASSGLPVSYTVTGPAILSGSTITINGAGPVTVTANQAGDADYIAATPVPQSFTVGKAPLTIEAGNVSVQYNQAIPALRGYTSSGFVNGESAAVLSGAPAESTAATQGSAPGNYPITIGQGSLAATNYTFNFVNGTLAIGKASQNITFGTLPNVTYGVSPVTLTATASSGLAPNYIVTGPASVSGSTLTITGAGSVTVTANQAGNTDYAAAAAVQQRFTVVRAPISVVVNNAVRPYGAVNPKFTGEVSGLANGDALTVDYSTAATKLSPIGEYPIHATVSGAKIADYSIEVTKGELTITKRALRVIVESAARVYDAANPVFSGTVTGLLNEARVEITYSTTAIKSSPVGDYPITARVSGLDAGNYKDEVTPGVLKIAPAPLPSPTLSPKGASYPKGQKVTISESVAGTTIYYTLNGSDPTIHSTKYTGPITLSETETIKAIATAPNHKKSPIMSQTYTVQ
jgi:hypothetical protein